MRLVCLCDSLERNVSMNFLEHKNHSGWGQSPTLYKRNASEFAGAEPVMYLALRATLIYCPIDQAYQARPGRLNPDRHVVRQRSQLQLKGSVRLQQLRR